MTLSHATSDRDWCKLDDLFNIPCFTLRGLLYEIHAVMRLSNRLGKVQCSGKSDAQSCCEGLWWGRTYE